MGSVLEKASAFSLYSFGIILGNKVASRHIVSR